MVSSPRRVGDIVGTAAIDVMPEMLMTLLNSLPSSCRIVGSEKGAHGVVRLLLASDNIAPCYEGAVTMTIEDAGLTRTVRVIPG